MIASMEAIPKRPPESSSISSSIPHLPLSIACYTVYSSIPTMSNLFFQEAKEFEMLLDNTANIVHKLKVNLIPIVFVRHLLVSMITCSCVSSLTPILAFDFYYLKLIVSTPAPAGSQHGVWFSHY
jgi:hypothetical protein